MQRLASRLAGCCLPVIATLALAASASAAPVAGPAGDAFYAPPSPLPAGSAGDLIWYRPTTVNLPGAPASKAWTVLYRSTDSKGAANAVTGTVIVPTTGISGARPIVSYAFGTQGLAQRCAPSRQLSAGTENYEQSNIIAALQKGWAVVSTDYAGYTTGDSPSYLAGVSEGNAVLDIVKAATQVPSVGLSYSAKTAVWGYSQGGQAASFAGERKATYAPGLNLAGVAAGGVPGDFFKTAKYLNGSAGASFLLGGVVGLATEFPDKIPFDELSNDAGKAARDAAKNQCVFETLNAYRNADISSFTKGGESLDELLAIPSVNEVISGQALGTKAIPAPVYQYHGQADEFIPLDQSITLKKAWCAKGVKVKYDLFPSEHIATQTQAPLTVIPWLADRFANRTPPTTCANTAPPPQSTADAPGGDFQVNLDNWQLKGSVYLAKLKQTLALPPTSSFTGSANLSTGLIDGQANITPFATTIKILGLGVKVSLIIEPAGRVNGTINLTDDGRLQMNATAPVILKIRSFGAFGINFGAGCRTERPVIIPLQFDGSVGRLGNGTFTSVSEASFPQLENCGLYAPILSSLMSGPNQRFTLTEVPPAPKPY